MLIHFTSDYNNIVSILRSQHLLLKYCRETFSNTKGIIASSAAHPMVSFSNYDEDELLKTPITYGHFGIQFKWEWAKKNNISPVIYMQNNSPAAEGLEVLLNERRNNKLLSPKMRLAIIKLKCFTKNAVGNNSKLEDKNFDFTREKEWRYVPNLKQIKGNRISENRSTYDNNYNSYNMRIKSYPLVFKITDIDTIYIKREYLSQFSHDFPQLINKVKESNWTSIEN
ncbi:abortive infection system antitoxin AbiGi family protein [Kluyvera sichuanensis]|uniref:abortive infection system antitoxin AbiGi family protein n=1 Tax=Kluyvera sichuanensis TaxID=2725494 RepID=UPI002FD19445